MKHTKPLISSLYLAFIFTGFAAANVSAADITELTSACEDCHGSEGVSKEPEIPTIGGLSAVYIEDSFTAYADKSRPCAEVKHISGPHKGETSDMCKSAEKLSSEEIKQLAEHYAAKPFVRASQTFDQELATKGKNVHALHCKKCHEDAGSSPDDDGGILAGQWMPYLENQFEAYASGKRDMPKKMKPKMDKITAEDTRALVHFYGSFQGP